MENFKTHKCKICKKKMLAHKNINGKWIYSYCSNVKAHPKCHFYICKNILGEFADEYIYKDDNIRITFRSYYENNMIYMNNLEVHSFTGDLIYQEKRKDFNFSPLKYEEFFEKIINLAEIHQTFK